MIKSGKENLPDRIRSRYTILSPAQKRVGNYLLSSYRSLAYVTLAELAELTSTSQGTVSRVAEALGYGSFSNLKSAIRSCIEESATKLEIYSPGESAKGDPTPFDTVFEMEKALMDDTYRLIRKQDFNRAVEIVSNAPSVIAAGTGSNVFLAEYAGYFLGTMKENVHIIKDANIHDMDLLLDAPEGSAAMIFSFPRYPAKTQTIAEAVRRKKMAVIGMTDSIVSPLAEYCDPLFLVPQKFITFMDPCAAVLSFIHSLLYGVYLINKDKCRKRIEARERLFEKERLFVSENVSLPDFEC